MSVLGRAAPFLAAGAAFSPLSIAGCLLWLDANDSNTITLASGKVSDWVDKSTSGKTFTQATASNRPVMDATKFTGKSFVNFGSAVSAVNRLTSASDISIPANSTVFVVGYWNGPLSGANRSICLQKGTSTGAINANGAVPYWAQYSISSTAGAFIAGRPSATVYAETATAAIANNSIFQSTVKLNSVVGSSIIRLDGANKTIGTIGTTVPSGNLVNTVGATDTTYTANGGFAEVLVYDTNLSTSDTLVVEAYLKTKWGTP